MPARRSAGRARSPSNAKTGAHHHAGLESVLYVLKGKARMCRGEKLRFQAGAYYTNT